MNRKLLTLLAALLLCSCGDGVLNQSEEQKLQDAKSRLYVTLVDHSDGKPIEGASLSLQSAGITATTAENGIALFEDLNVGTHLLRIEAEDQGYAAAIVRPSVAEISVAGDGGRANQAIYRLYHKSASLEGYVQHTDSKGQIKALTGLPVRITFSSSCNLAETATDAKYTDSKGKFKFDSLPAVDNGCSYSVETIGAVIGNQTYSAMTLPVESSPSLRKGGKAVIASPIDVDKGDNLFTVVNYNKEINGGAENTPVVFTFSEKIPANQQEKVTIYSSSVGYNVEIKDNVITIRPASKWEKTFEVSFNGLRSESGKIYNDAFSITVRSKDIRDSIMGGLKLATTSILYSDERASVIFKRLDGATGYNFYLNENGKKTSTVTDKCNVVTETIGTIIVDCPIAISDSNAVHSPRIGDNQNKLIVQAYNTYYESQKDTLLIKETKPEVPTLSKGSYICVPSVEKGKILDPYSECEARTQNAPDVEILLDSYSAEIMRAFGSTTESAEYSGNIYFSRAMDTKPIAFVPATDCIVAPGTENPCTRLLEKVTYEWLNEQVLSVKVKVAAGLPLPSGGSVNVGIAIRNLIGKNALPFNDGLTPSSPNLIVKISGIIPSPCNANPFASAGCSTADTLLFCNDLDRYSATPNCQTRYPSPCDLSNIKGTYFCPILPLTSLIFSEDFESGNLFSTKSNYESVNKWIRGTEAAYNGNYSAYISDNGSAYEYNEVSKTEEYLYRKINFPSTSDYEISFSWKGLGEGARNWRFDYMIVCLIPEAEFGTEDDGCSPLGERLNIEDPMKRNVIGKEKDGYVDYVYNGSNVWKEEQLTRRVQKGNHYLVFLWANDDTKGSSPIAIDDIEVYKR